MRPNPTSMGRPGPRRTDGSLRGRLATGTLLFMLAGGLSPVLFVGCSSSNSDSTTTQDKATTPLIGTSPQSRTVVAGTDVTFTVAATGNGTLTYQWSKGGQALAGKTAASLALPAVTSADAGSYTVLVTNTLNGTTATATSAAAVLTVQDAAAAPTISSGPASLEVTAGAAANFSVTATGNGTLSYQWFKDDQALQGQTGAALSIAAASLTDAGSYTVKVTNTLNGTTASTTSAAATLTVDPAATLPLIATPPLTQTFNPGDTVTLSVAATGNGTLTYQWAKDGQDLTGKTAASLVLSNMTAADAGSYTVKVTDTLNGTSLSVVSDAAVLTMAVQALAFTQDLPATTTVTAPAAATFTVAVSGATSPTYEWQLNGTDIQGASGPSYSTTATDFNAFNPGSGTFTYHVIVKDGDRTITSKDSVLTLVAPSPTYPGFGDPQAVPSRPLTVLPSYHQDTVHFPNGSFRFGYDEALKEPAWTAYGSFTMTTAFPNGSRSFRPDDRLLAPQVTTDEMGTHGNLFYLGSGTGYDRGHMVTLSDLAYHYDFAAFGDGQYPSDDTCRMPNVVPQVSYFNQRLWSNLEDAVCGSSSNGGLNSIAPDGRAYIYTGPVFTTAFGASVLNYWVPGPSGSEFYTTNPAAAPSGWPAIAMPTATYKVVFIAPATSGSLPKVLAWVASNRPYTSGESGTDLWKYVTSLAEIEKLTGLDFTPGVAHDATLAAWKAMVNVKGLGSSFEKSSGPNVQMIEPAWDVVPLASTPGQSGETLATNASVTFTGAAGQGTSGAAVDPNTGVSWNFGDGTGTFPGLSVNHAFATAGTYTVTFTATDSASASNSISRTVTVADPAPANQPPTFTPGTLPDLSITLPTATTAQTFTVQDGHTASNAFTFTFGSDNTAVLDPTNSSQISVAYNTGNWTVTLNPVVTGIVSATVVNVTVTATGATGASTAKTFKLTINPAAASGNPLLIISQYYEGTSNNKWIEVTNVGNGNYDASVSPMYIGEWVNPRTTNTFYTLKIPGTIAPKASILFRNGSAKLPASSYNSGATSTTNGTPIVSDTSVIAFNGNDVMYLTPVASPANTSTASYDARTDVIGGYIAPGTDQTILDWDPATTVIIPAGWGAAAAPGTDRSYVRAFAVIAPNATYTPSEWNQVDATQITTANPGLCETAAVTDTNFLGYHAYQGGNP